MFKAREGREMIEPGNIITSCLIIPLTMTGQVQSLMPLAALKEYAPASA